MHIKFDKVTKPATTFFNIMDWRYAPVGTYTSDYDWRQNAQGGEFIDAVDAEMDWYKSFVLAVRETEVEGEDKPVKEVLVAYRNHTEDGHRQEKDGRRFDGWSSKYDEWRDAADPRIQRYASVMYDYTRVDVKNHAIA